jgi:broad specificity phosphatase PhoE
VIYFVRHGETDWNREARLQGQRDVPLNALGRVQAGEAGRKLAALVPDPGSLAYIASPLGRTRETMELLRGAMRAASMA